MQHGHTHRVALVTAILDAPGKWSDVRKVPFRQERANLDLRMNAVFNAAVHLQNEAVTENDGCIRLFSLQHRGREIRMALAPGLAKPAIVSPGQFPGST